MSDATRPQPSGAPLSDVAEYPPEAVARAERVREALVACALAAYEDAGVRGLCAEGAWEAAVTAMRQLDVVAIATGAGPAPSRSAGGGDPAPR